MTLRRIKTVPLRRIETTLSLRRIETTLELSPTKQASYATDLSTHRASPSGSLIVWLPMPVRVEERPDIVPQAVPAVPRGLNTDVSSPLRTLLPAGPGRKGMDTVPVT